MKSHNRKQNGVGLASSPTSGNVDVVGCDKCQLCKSNLLADHNYVSAVTRKAFKIHTKYLETHLKLGCTSHNVIYLMTCLICTKQYVGQTTQKLKERMYKHKHENNLYIA